MTDDFACTPRVCCSTFDCGLVVRLTLFLSGSGTTEGSLRVSSCLLARFAHCASLLTGRRRTTCRSSSFVHSVRSYVTRLRLAHSLVSSFCIFTAVFPFTVSNRYSPAATGAYPWGCSFSSRRTTNKWFCWSSLMFFLSLGNLASNVFYSGFVPCSGVFCHLVAPWPTIVFTSVLLLVVSNTSLSVCRIPEVAEISKVLVWKVLTQQMSAGGRYTRTLKMACINPSRSGGLSITCRWHFECLHESLNLYICLWPINYCKRAVEFNMLLSFWKNFAINHSLYSASIFIGEP